MHHDNDGDIEYNNNNNTNNVQDDNTDHVNVRDIKMNDNVQKQFKRIDAMKVRQMIER